MSSDKVDSRLRAEMERVERSGGPGTTLPVIIEHVTMAAADDGEADLAALQRGVRAAQAGLERRLTAMGAEDVQPMILANALAARLTPAQIREMAGDPDVKRILGNQPERVTTENP